MSHKLTPARQNSLLSHYHWAEDGRLRVQCTHRTEPLLRVAGVSRPRVMEFYLVAVKRDRSGFLVIDHEAQRPAPASAGELFEVGGIFHGEDAPPDVPGGESARRAPVENPAQRAMTEQTLALLAGRQFEIPTGPHSKVRLLVVAMEDEALPAPGEPEQWKARAPKDADVHAAVAALHMARELAHHER